MKDFIFAVYESVEKLNLEPFGKYLKNRSEIKMKCLKGNDVRGKTKAYNY